MMNEQSTLYSKGRTDRKPPTFISETTQMRLIGKILITTLAFWTIMLRTISGAHAISFDEFNDLPQQQGVATSTVLTVDTSTINTASAIGGVRYLEAKTVGEPRRVEADIDAGIYYHSQAASARGTSLIRWDGDANPGLQHNGLGGIDLTEDGSTAIRIRVYSFDYPDNKTLPIRVTLYDASNSDIFFRGQIVLSSSITTPTDFLIPLDSINFASLGQVAGDISQTVKNVGAIDFFVDGSANPAYDLELSFIGTNGKCVDLVPKNGFILDECGVCNGDNSTCSDCEGIPNGPAKPNIGYSCPTGDIGLCSTGKYTGTPPNNCICTPDYTPKNELCDNLDNDCNGAIDEGLGKGNSCSVGIGACKNDGSNICAPDGSVICSVNPKAPTTEICDNVDNDCDGATDEDFDKGASCSEGVGACLRTGVKQCSVTGGISCTAVPGTPTTEICDNIDNDCDGLIDEDLDKGASCSVGVGSCQRNGVKQCGQSGEVVCSAVAGAPQAESCDNADNDCDGQVDEDLDKGGSCTVGVGACQTTGVKICGMDGSVMCSSTPGTPSTEICDGIDNDCDGLVDEDAPTMGPLVDQCGICKGDGKSCLDCKGTVNGTAKVDECNVCGGDGTSCLQCSTFDQSNTLGDLDSGAKEQQKIVRGAVVALRSIPSAAREARFISKTLEAAQRLQILNWELSWSLPVIATDCTFTTSVCVSTSNLSILGAYRENNLKLRNLALDVMKKVKRYRRNRLTARDKRILQSAEKQFQANLTLSQTVPESQFACTSTAPTP